MKIDTKDLVFLLNKLNVSVSQFLFLLMIQERLYASLYSYEEKNAGFSREEINDLIEKGYITNVKSDKDNYIDSYETTDKFRTEFFTRDESAAAEEFWEMFPPYLSIDGRKIPTKTVDKEKFLAGYSKKIGKYSMLHNKVMEALDHALNNGMISMGIEKWYLSEQWNEVLKGKTKAQTHGHFPSEKVF